MHHMYCTWITSCIVVQNVIQTGHFISKHKIIFEHFLSHKDHTVYMTYTNINCKNFPLNFFLFVINNRHIIKYKIRITNKLLMVSMKLCMNLAKICKLT